MMKHVEMTGQVRTVQNIVQNTRYMYMYVLHVMISLFLLSESVALDEEILVIFVVSRRRRERKMGFFNGESWCIVQIMFSGGGGGGNI